MEAESKNHNSITSGVEICPKLTPTSSRLVWAGVLDNWFDTYFYVEDAQTGEWHNLFLNPDVISKDKVEAHKEYLRVSCCYAVENLDVLRCLLINLCSTELISEISVYAEDTLLLLFKVNTIPICL